MVEVGQGLGGAWHTEKTAEEMTNGTPGQVVSTSSSCWHEMLREEEASQEITFHPQGSGSKSPLSRLQGRGQDTLGYVFSAGRAPGHRAPTNPVTTAPP